MFNVKPKYSEKAVAPMREELTKLGVKELKTADGVDQILSNDNRSVLLFINSVCGCAAGSARPGLAIALQNENLPDQVATVFAGVDTEAVSQARSYISGYPPSSPSIALFKNGELVHMTPRYEIEGKYPEEIASDLKMQFDQYCS
jgi:putative YphP/YqiW family bacilliredoxin